MDGTWISLEPDVQADRRTCLPAGQSVPYPSGTWHDSGTQSSAAGHLE